jgi:hypothetical protein
MYTVQTSVTNYHPSEIKALRPRGVSRTVTRFVNLLEGRGVSTDEKENVHVLS